MTEGGLEPECGSSSSSSWKISLVLAGEVRGQSVAYGEWEGEKRSWGHSKGVSEG